VGVPGIEPGTSRV